MCSLRWWHSSGALLLHNSLLLSRHLQWIMPPMNGPFSLFSHRQGPRRWILIQHFTLHMALSWLCHVSFRRTGHLCELGGALSFFLSFLRSDKSDYKWRLALISQCYFLNVQTSICRVFEASQYAGGNILRFAVFFFLLPSSHSLPPCSKESCHRSTDRSHSVSSSSLASCW